MVAGRRFEVCESRVQSRGRGSNLEVADLKSQVGKMICVKLKFEFEATE